MSDTAIGTTAIGQTRWRRPYCYDALSAHAYKFTGNERDSESGLDMFGARHYGSSLGRFMTPDWAAKPTNVPYANFGNPQSLNLYSYVENNPTTTGDPDGHCPDGCPVTYPTTLAQLDQQNQANSDFLTGALEGAANFITSSLNRFATMGQSSTEPISQIQPTNENQAIGMTAATLGLGAASLAADGPAAASTLERNAANGAAFEKSVVAATKATDVNVAEQVTLKTESGIKTRMDVVSTRTSGEIRLQEAKSSATAPLTKNQQLAHPEIAKTGATVVGQGKPGYPGGTQIPPDKGRGGTSKSIEGDSLVSIEQLDVVDIVSIDKQTGHVILTISDHLDWSDSVAHQTALQAKFNKYLAFIESGEILTRYPEAKGRPVVIKVVLKYKPDLDGCSFLSRAKAVIESAGFSLRHELFAESYDN
jgi:RHS repeat-associated protein